MNNKKWFSIIEIIITISIIVLLAVIWISSKRWYDENVSNTKVVADTKTINNALEQYIQENKTLPNPGWNTNYFKIDTSYAHAYEDIDTFWVYGSLTEETLPKQYLDILPLDPRTNSYYSYGKAKNSNEFEVASIQMIDWVVVSKVIWNYTAENWPYNLIREYNWPNFVYNWSETNFPYNPDELILIATDKEKNVYREWDTIEIALNGDVTLNWKPEIVTSATGWLELFFSDWSVSILEPNSKLTLNKLNFKGKDNLNTLVQLWLEAWQIWTKATKLNDNSEFEIYTSDSSAAVRWTIFWVIKTASDTDVIVLEWEVAILENPTLNEIDNTYTTGSLEESTTDDNWYTINKYKWIKIIEKIKVDKRDEIPENRRAKKKKLKKYQSEVIAQTTIISSDENNAVFDNEELLIPEYSVDPKTQTPEYEIKIQEYQKSLNEELLNKEALLKEPDHSDITIDEIPEACSYTMIGWVCCKTFGINDVCQDSENTLEWYNLVAYAPYNESGNLKLYKSWGEYVLNHQAILNNVTDLPSFCNNSISYKTNSFCQMTDWTNWVFIDKEWTWNLQDYLKYSNLDLTWDFAIEMNVRVPNDTDKHYILFNAYLKLYIGKDDWKLYLNGYSNDLLTKWVFNKIYVIKEWSKVYVSVWNSNSKIDTNQSITTISELWVWYYQWSSNYSFQLNDIIDYVKIYKKLP